ncbi:hypothetical protein [Arthrobacter sp. JCM 19049]|uniref:sodium:solute symporter family transporter n=1 Tax=Arthrobacter sp. JCM 19049 TaxID=1460643 RepID=UPI0024366F0F|nr:hypothetical protein [Arthrobacter sp. JCM 19049]
MARTAGAYSMIFNLLFIPGPYLVGMFALLLLPNLANPEIAIFEVADAVLPSFAVGIVMAAIMAAIMSTADALLLQAGTIAGQDIYARFINRKMTDGQMVWVSRITVLLLAVIGYVIAAFDPPASPRWSSSPPRCWAAPSFRRMSAPCGGRRRTPWARFPQ